MKKAWIIIALSFITVGIILFTGVMTMLDWDFKKLSTAKYQTVTHSITDAFDSISIDSSIAKINFAVSDENKIECIENEKMPYTVTVKDGVLTIGELDNRKWYDHIGIFFRMPEITLNLSKTEFENLTLKNTTGDVNVVKGFSFTNADIRLTTGDIKYFADTSESLKLRTTTGDIEAGGTSPKDVNATSTTGKIELTDITCGNLTAGASTGDVILSNVVAEKEFNIECTTGDIIFDKCDAGVIFAGTTTGDISGSLLSEKVFITKTSTGRISVPQTLSGGKCELKTTTGDIKISLQ